MSNNTDQRETINATVEDDEPIRVVVEEKDGFFKKCGHGISKFMHSTPGKIIGGIALVSVGAVGAILAVALSGDKDDEADNDVIDCTQFVVDDEAQEDSDNAEVE